MFGTILALMVRIISNPLANSLQKILSERHSAILINCYSYAFLSLFCIFPAVKYSWTGLDFDFWGLVCLAGILCTAGSVCLIKALQCGEISILGPINSYKCVVGLVFAFVLLGEIPTIAELIGLILIIYGSGFIANTIREGGILTVLKRKDIILRFTALFFTGCEAVILKKIILLSSVTQSFVLWCFSGFIFSLVLMFIFRIKPVLFSSKDIFYTIGISFCLGLMQLSTNMIFERMNVGIALALFQLSGVLAVIFGWKVFREANIRQKLTGVLIMILGSTFILVK